MAAFLPMNLLARLTAPVEALPGIAFHSAEGIKEASAESTARNRGGAYLENFVLTNKPVGCIEENKYKNEEQ